MINTGKFMICIAVALIVVAYTNFAPTALQSDMVVGYVKNHFVREIIFGTGLVILTINQTIMVSSTRHILKVALMGSIVVLPFWIAVLFGWSTGGLADVWGDKINPSAAYYLHGSQLILFYLGLTLLLQGLRNNSKTQY
jgi:hypothetical protein